MTNPPGPAWYAGPESDVHVVGGPAPERDLPLLRCSARVGDRVVPCTTPFGRPVVPDV